MATKQTAHRVPLTNGAAPGITKEQIAEYHRQAEAQAQQRAQQCSERLAELLKEFECDLVGIPQITADGRILVAIQLVAK